MISPGKCSRATLQALSAMLLFSTAAAAQIPGHCNTGQTTKTAVTGCTAILVTPSNTARDGNWGLAYPYPTTLSKSQNPCLFTFIRSSVVPPNLNWLPNSVSTASEWMAPYDGENNLDAGYYLYATLFPVPSKLPNGSAPTGVTISGQLSSDNDTVAIYLQSRVGSGACSPVSGQSLPVNPPPPPPGNGGNDFSQWWPFSFTNSQPITPGTSAALYFVVQNTYDADSQDGKSPAALRVEFFSSSAFQ
jgi:hypothetical protein